MFSNSYLDKSSSLISSTRASADLLIMAFVTTPVCPRAAPSAKPGKIYLERDEKSIRILLWFHGVVQLVQTSSARFAFGDVAVVDADADVVVIVLNESATMQIAKWFKSLL